MALFLGGPWHGQHHPTNNAPRIVSAYTYTPNPPTPSGPPPCDGQPWRIVEGDIECIASVPSSPADSTLPATGTTMDFGATIFGAALLITIGGVFIRDAIADRRKRAAK